MIREKDDTASRELNARGMLNSQCVGATGQSPLQWLDSEPEPFTYPQNLRLRADEETL